MTTDTVIHEKAISLRAIAAWLDSHPEFEVHQIDLMSWDGRTAVRNYGVSSAEELATKARAVGGRWDKVARDDLFTLRQEIAPGVVAELTGMRSSVCERIVTGKREIAVSEPDPKAVEALPKITRTVVVEDAEWVCGPLLAGAEA